MRTLRRWPTLPQLSAAAQAARTASTPLAVKERRKQVGLSPTERPSGHVHDAIVDGLTPSDYVSYRRQLQYARRKNTAEPLTTGEWAANKAQLRERVRGLQRYEWTATSSGSSWRRRRLLPTLQEDQPEDRLTTQVVGRKVFLPNVVFKLVRNFTLPGQAYNPHEATFRLPHSITKADIRSYLLNVYGVETTYIRTDNYFSPIKRNSQTGAMDRSFPHKSYKRAVVGLVHPFYYPQLPEYMSKKDQDAREEWMEKTFMVTAVEALQKSQMLRVTRQGSPNWRWRSTTEEGMSTAKRGTILKRIMQERANRHTVLLEAKEHIAERRKKGEPVLPGVGATRPLSSKLAN